MSGYNTGYMLAKGEPVFLHCNVSAVNYSKGFEAGYADGSWEYRDYNFNLSARMKSTDEGFFSGYVNGYILGHMEKMPKENAEIKTKLAEMQAKNDGLEKELAALEKSNAEFGKRTDDLETKNEALEKRVKDLEAKISKP
jgi:BMFP domain-containing protein YqiC